MKKLRRLKQYQTKTGKRHIYKYMTQKLRNIYLHERKLKAYAMSKSE